eukprot:TRINITY_DN11580_c0_g1_i1.p1 TRINITY_DN11580_c0_g1~~TRINITY_DN11580_c0_g1_i1.p1  ORF type:complete len:219 (-),score=-19.86 TRINITY_DN11580_c0_g1_i1:4-567(-)
MCIRDSFSVSLSLQLLLIHSLNCKFHLFGIVCHQYSNEVLIYKHIYEKSVLCCHYLVLLNSKIYILSNLIIITQYQIVSVKQNDKNKKQNSKQSQEKKRVENYPHQIKQKKSQPDSELSHKPTPRRVILQNIRKENQFVVALIFRINRINVNMSLLLNFLWEIIRKKQKLLKLNNDIVRIGLPCTLC